MRTLKAVILALILFTTSFYSYTKVDVDQILTGDGYGGGTMNVKDNRLLKLSDGTLVAFFCYNVHVTNCFVGKKSTDGGNSWYSFTNTSTATETPFNFGNTYDMKTNWTSGVDSADNIYLIYKPSADMTKLMVQKVTPSSWPGANGIGTAVTIATDAGYNGGGNNCGQPSIIADSIGGVYVAYEATSTTVTTVTTTTYGIKVKYSNDQGATWSAVGPNDGLLPNASPADGRMSPAITIWNDKPFVVFIRAAYTLAWSHYTGGAWVTTATSTWGSYGGLFSVAVTGTSPNQTVHIATNTGSTGTKIQHRYTSGTVVTALADWTSASDIHTNASDLDPSLVSDGTHLWMFFSRYVDTNIYNIAYKVWNGSWSSYTDVFADVAKYRCTAPVRSSTPGSIPFIWSSYVGSPMKVISSHLYDIPQVTSISTGTGVNTTSTTISIAGNRFYKETWADVSSIKLVNGPTVTQYSLSGYSAIDNSTITTAAIPAGCIAGTYDVRVTTTVGNSTDTVKFTVTGNLPIVSNINANTAANTVVKTVTISGSNFFGGTATSDILSVKFDDTNTTALTFSALTVTDTSIEGAVIPDKIPGGTYNVIVTTHAGANTTSTVKFGVTSVSPTVVSITPTWASSTNNTTVTITGTGFFGGTITSDIRAIKLSDNFVLTYATAVVSDTDIKGVIVPIGSAPGSYDVRVTTGGGVNSTSTVMLEIKSGPKVYTVTPAIGSNLTTTTLTLSGLGFFGAISAADISAIKLSDTATTSLTFNPVNVVSDDTVHTVIVPPGVKAGTYDVRVTTGLGANATSTQTFAVTTTVPLVTNVSPTESFNNQLTTISISGSRFFGGTNTTNVLALKLSDGTNIDFSTAVISDTSISPCIIPIGVTSGTYDVRVTTGGSNNATSTVKFWVKSSYAVVSTLTPNTGANSAVKTVNITGQNFFGGFGSSVVQNIKLNDPHTVLITTYSVESDTYISGAVLPPGILAGSWDVQIQSTQGTNTTSVQKFIVTTVAPTISAYTPSLISNTGSNTVTISGTKFYGGTEAWIYEETDVRGITIYGPLFNTPVSTGLSSYTCISDTTIRATIPSGLNPGYYDLRVTTGGGVVTTASPLRIQAPVPVVTNIVPNSNVNTGSLTITVTGSNFFGGIGTDSVGAIFVNTPDTMTSLTKITVISDNSLVCVLPTGVFTGEFDIKVYTAGDLSNDTSVVKFYSMISSTATNVITHYSGLVINIPANTVSGNCAVLVKDKATDTTVVAANKLKYQSIKCPAALDNTVKEITLTNSAVVSAGKTITLTLNYTPAAEDPIVESKFRAMYLGTDNKWSFVDGTQQVDTDLNTVLSSLTHLSIFRVGQYIVQAADLSNVVVYPNPVDFSTAVGGTLKFVNLTYNPTLRVFTISGEPVKAFAPDLAGNLGNDGRIEWDGNNDSGSLITRGLYIYMITDEAGNRKTGKFVVK